jgi:hypothetical protein
MFTQVGGSDRTKPQIHSSLPFCAVTPKQTRKRISATRQLSVGPSNERRWYHRIFTLVFLNAPREKPHLSPVYMSRSMHLSLCTPWLILGCFSVVIRLTMLLRILWLIWSISDDYVLGEKEGSSDPKERFTNESELCGVHLLREKKLTICNINVRAAVPQSV